MTAWRRWLAVLAIAGGLVPAWAAEPPADPAGPRPLFDKALAADRKGGQELFAIAWYRAYLAAAPKAGNAAAVRGRIERLEVEVEAKVRELLHKAAAAAAGLAEGDERTRAFRRIAAVLAGAGDFTDAEKIAASLPAASDREYVLMHSAIARMRNGNPKGAAADIARITNPFFAATAKKEVAWVQAITGNLAGAWRTADSIVDDQVRSWAYAGIAEAEFSAGDTQGAGRAIASAKKAASQIPEQVIRSNAYAKIVEAQLKGADTAGAGETANLVSYAPVRARVDGLIVKARQKASGPRDTSGRSEIDTWTDIAQADLAKPHFVNFPAFWQSLHQMGAPELVEALLTASSDFLNALNLLRDTEMLWWARRPA